MSAREEILAAIRARRGAGAEPHPPRWQQSPPSKPLVEHFIDRAGAAAAQVKHLVSADEIPGAVAEALRARNLPAIVHLPPDPALAFDWSATPGLTLKREPPGPDDAAVAIAPFGLAETGTLVYPASVARPVSWHFRAGLEIAVIAADCIQADVESVLAQIKTDGDFPSTINLVTGPSRTGDIEQTLELGAHGPKELVVLIVPSLPK